jgi:hypothetical protein
LWEWLEANAQHCRGTCLARLETRPSSWLSYPGVLHAPGLDRAPSPHCRQPLGELQVSLPTIAPLPALIWLNQERARRR